MELLANCHRKRSRSVFEITELIWNLPEGGAFDKALAGELSGWGVDRIMRMMTVNQAMILNYHTLKIAGVKNIKKPKLLEIPQPKSATPDETSLAIEARKLEEWLTEED